MSGTKQIFRGVNDTQELNGRIYIMSFRRYLYCNRFKPIVAKTIYDMTDAKTVLDTSMGWGDRCYWFLSLKCMDILASDLI